MLETEREGEREKERERGRERQRDRDKDNYSIKLVYAHEHKVQYVHSTMYCNILLIICLFERGDLLLVLCVQSVG